MLSCDVVRTVPQRERAASFETLASLQVGSIPLRDHVMRRTAIVINATIESDEAELNGSSVTIQGQKGDDLSFGAAAAIDPRGYFLTGAHCITESTVVLGYPSPDGLEMIPARVVYKGDPVSDTADVAVLHIPRPLKWSFEWAGVPTVGQAVASSGVFLRKQSKTKGRVNISLAAEMVGGHVRELMDLASEPATARLIMHDSPLTHGHSGGPVVATDGRLLGINIAGPAAFPFRHHPIHRFGNALQPDLRWLRRVIEEDAAGQ